MTSDDKKDLTRIEDLGEFIHELNSEEEPQDDFSSDLSDLPDLPADEDEPSSFETETSFGGDSFTSDETSSAEEDSPFSSDFGSSEESPFGSESDEALSFESNDESFSTSFEEEESSPFTDPVPETSEFSTSDFASAEGPSESTASNEEPDWNTPSLEAAPEPEIDEAPLETDLPQEIEPEPVYTPEPSFKAPETFDDLKKFSESSNFSGMATEGNPSFSVLVKNVKYIEDVNDIVSLLRELKLLADSEEQTKGRLMRGMLLIPRVSEYAAIFLAHKLRRYDVDIQVGLSDEIHPPKHQETPETGIVSKHSLYQNQSHHFHFDDPKLELSQIIVAATSSLEGYQVLRYMGVASEHKILDSEIVEDETSSAIPAHYQELAQKLKAHALKNHANAVVGLNYQLTPIPSEFGMGGHKYRLSCTGNLVWVNKL